LKFSLSWFSMPLLHSVHSIQAPLLS